MCGWRGTSFPPVWFGTRREVLPQPTQGKLGHASPSSVPREPRRARLGPARQRLGGWKCL